MSQKKSIDKIEGCRNVDARHSSYYVVLRSGRRVSDTNHDSKDSADAEANYWINILRRYPDGTKISVKTCKNPNHK